MASLTHVCMWTDDGWVRISAKEASRIRSIGKVAAYSGLFMCELCNQYVTLAHGEINVPHFRHSSREADKSCPERVLGSTVSTSYRASDYSLPLRIVVAKNRFQIELGLPCVPEDLFESAKQIKITIHPFENDSQSFVYDLGNWMKEFSTTWLSLGCVPSPLYTIETKGSFEGIHFYWPHTVQGIDFRGAVFDGETGRMLAENSDVQIGKPYYILQRDFIRLLPQSVESNQVKCYNSTRNTWYLFRVIAHEFEESAAKLFLRYHCRLTKKPVSMQMVWPEYIENPYIIRHKNDPLWFYVYGKDVLAKNYPSAQQTEYPISDAAVICIDTHSRQQVVSTGRSKMLQYTYLWKDSLNAVTYAPTVIVETLKEQNITSGETNELPYKKTIRILSEKYDGTVLISHRGQPIDRRRLKAGEYCELSNIQFGMKIQVKIGLDCIWWASFERQGSDNSLKDQDLLRRLENGRGPLMPIPHSLGAVSVNFSSFPMVTRWLYHRIREGSMPESSYRILQSLTKNQLLER